VGRFIAENIQKDPKSRVLGKNTVALLAGDLVELVETAGSALMSKIFGSGEDEGTTHRDVEEKLTKLLGEDNLVGAAGEFGLLFAFLANKPGAREVEGEPAVAVGDLRAMFVDKHLPEGWETWKKSRIDWVRDTTGLLISAAKAYRTLKRIR
jgi:hypothetical protein